MGTKEPNQLTEIFKRIAPRLIDVVIRRTEFATQDEFAKVSGINSTTISRYRKKTSGPLKNIGKLMKVGQLGLEEIGWLLGYIMETEFRAHRFALPPASAEIKEPAIPYGTPSLAERLEVVMAIDFTGLDAEEMFILTRQRKDLCDVCETLLDSQQSETAKCLELLKSFEANCRFTIRRALDRRSGSGR